ncbi:MAG TPA: VOC family protein [Caulobacteraceae bacterium]|jgi:predicted enzyme related to lactoylglutathione lyase
MAGVVGLGGVFYKAADQAAVKDWYSRVLGVEFSKWGGAKFAHPQIGVTQVALFAADSGYMLPSDLPFMINLIVDDLDGVLKGVEAAGEKPLGREDHEYGKFAWLMDPAGVKIELWEPAGPNPV